MLKVEQCYSFSGDGCVTGNEGGGSGASLIHNGKNGIVAICSWQLGDDVALDWAQLFLLPHSSGQLCIIYTGDQVC